MSADLSLVTNLLVSSSLFLGAMGALLSQSRKNAAKHNPSSYVNSQRIIKKIVLTGGPCSGKTTSMEKIQVFLRERGFRVFVATGKLLPTSMKYFSS